MTSPSFERINALPAGCPSDFALDRLLHGELEHDETRRLEQHCAGCEICAPRLKRLRSGFEAFPELDEQAVLRRIEGARADGEAGLAARLWAWLGAGPRGFASLAFVAAAALFFVVRPSDHQQTTPSAGQGTRLKGALALRVYRQHGSRSEAVTSGERFAPGDKLRFEIDTPRDGYVMIVGVEADGDVYAAWPIAADGAASKLAAGPRQALPGAVALDDTLGKEALYLVHCGTPFEIAQCKSLGAEPALTCASDCALSPFMLDKTP